MSTDQPIRHEPIASETLKHGAGEAQRQADPNRAPGADPRDEPLREGDGETKRHGDALQTGTGTRHGVHDPDQRPDA